MAFSEPSRPAFGRNRWNEAPWRKTQQPIRPTSPAATAAEPSEIQNLLDTVQRLSTKAGEVMDKLSALIDANSSSLTASLKNVETFTKTLADNSEPVGSFIRGAAELAHSLARFPLEWNHSSDKKSR